MNVHEEAVRLEAELRDAEHALTKLRLLLEHAGDQAHVSDPELRRIGKVLFDERRAAVYEQEGLVQSLQAAIRAATTRQNEQRRAEEQKRCAETLGALIQLIEDRGAAGRKLQQSIGVVVSDYRNLLAANGSLQSAIVENGIIPPSPTIFTGLVQATEHELFRQSAPPVSLGRPGEARTPAFPGSHSPDFRLVGNPGAAKPLSSVIDETNNLLARHLETKLGQPLVPPSVKAADGAEPLAAPTPAPTPSEAAHPAAHDWLAGLDDGLTAPTLKRKH